MRYWCSNCEEAVDPVYRSISEVHAEVDTKAYEEFNIAYCPYCNEELTEEADKCECGEWKPKCYQLCSGCSENAEEAWNIALDFLMKCTNMVRGEAEDMFCRHIEQCHW